MKPILFNTDMVRTLLDGRKTETRRVVKPPPPDNDPHNVCFDYIENGIAKFGMRNQAPHFVKSPYNPGDILYVRETWNTNPLSICEYGNETDKYVYKADYDGHGVEFSWHPSIHMPKDAARIFLRVTTVRVERLQEISDDSIVKEGVGFRYAESEISSFIYRSFFKDLWNSTIKKSDCDKFGWDANPFVWVIEFERVAKG